MMYEPHPNDMLRIFACWGSLFSDAGVVPPLSILDAKKQQQHRYEGGGLFRHNWLVKAEPLHLEPQGTWVTSTVSSSASAVPSSAAAATVIANATVENFGAGSASFVVKATVYDADDAMVATVSSAATTVAAGGKSDVVIVNVPVVAGSLKLWSVQSPYLYTTTVEVVDPSSGKTVDATNFTTGIWTVTWNSDTGMHLNGKAVKLRGFCDHSNFGGVGGAVADRIQLFRAQALRSVGDNAWRMAHNPPAIARLDVMDRLGMVAMDENRDYGGNQGQGLRRN